MNKHTNGSNGHSTSHGPRALHALPEDDALPAMTSPPAVLVPTASHTNPSTALIEAMLVKLDAMAAQLGTRATPLTIAERQRLLKMKTGGGEHAQLAVKLAQRYGLAIPTVDPQAVASDVQFVNDVAMLLARFDVVRGLVNDMALEAQSRTWRAGTTAYTMLTRLVPQFPSLQRELTPMASFLARQYKDAPMSLRKQERKALQRRRAKKGAKAAPATSVPMAPPAPIAPSEPSAPTASASVAGSAAKTSAS